MRINNNIASLRAYTHLLRTGRDLDRAVARLSSGFQINTAADDAAGYAVSRKLRNQINGMNMASRNSMDGVSLIGTAEGALNEVHAMLQRVRELAIQAANDTNVYEDRRSMQDEIEQLFLEMDDIAYKTEFNTIKMLAGLAEPRDADPDANEPGFRGMRLQIGANSGMVMTVRIPDIRGMLGRIAARHFGNHLDDDGVPTVPSLAAPHYPDQDLFPDLIYPGTDRINDPFPNNDNFRTTLTDRLEDGSMIVRVWAARHPDGRENDALAVENAQRTITFVDDAMADVSRVRSRLGAYENRLFHTYDNLSNTRVQTEAALSRIRDADMALEMSRNAKFSVIQQAGIAIMGQANQRPQQVLQLLG